MYSSAQSRSDSRYSRTTTRRLTGGDRATTSSIARSVHYVVACGFAGQTRSRRSRCRDSTHDRTAPEHPIDDVLPGEARVLVRRPGVARRPAARARGLWPFLGPAFIAAVAYVDPGNFATNMAAGSRYGYLLLWVVLAANLMAMLVQRLTAKLGIATGQEPAGGLPRAVLAPHEHLLWLQAEVDRDGDGPRRVRRRGGRAQPPVRHSALPGRAAHGRGRVRHPRAADTRLPAPRGADRRAHRRDRRGFASRSPREAVAVGVAEGCSCRASPGPRACCSPSGSSVRP